MKNVAIEAKETSRALKIFPRRIVQTARFSLHVSIDEDKTGLLASPTVMTGSTMGAAKEETTTDTDCGEVEAGGEEDDAPAFNACAANAIANGFNTGTAAIIRRLQAALLLQQCKRQTIKCRTFRRRTFRLSRSSRACDRS